MGAFCDSKTLTMEDYGIRSILTKEAKYQTWLDVETALAQAQAQVGMIPELAARQIKSVARYENLDLEEMDRIFREIGHGFVPFLKVFVSICPEESGKYVHYGITTQNVQQTSQLLQIKKVHEKFLEISGKILENLSELAMTYKDAVMPGRTHGRHAIPITYGYKVSVWISELMQALDRMQECEKRVFQCMMGGAVGAFNSMPEKGIEIQKLVAETLGMHVMTVPSRNISTHKVEYIMNLALLANVFHKIGEEVFSTSIEEFSEVSEGFKKNTVGSSTMPHKVNPKLSKGIIANSQKLYSLTGVGLYSSSRPYEGDSSSYMLFQGVVEEAVELMIEIILRAEELTRELQVHADHLLYNVNLNQGLDNSEYLMMKMADKLGKDQAHALMYQLAMEQLSTKGSYLDILMDNAVISEHFAEEELKDILDPASYTGLSSLLAVQMAKEAHEYAEKLGATVVCL